VQVRRDDGVAIHIGPEPCAVVRKGGGEASVGEHIGQPLSLAKIHIPGADAVAKAKGDTDGRASASARTTRRGRRTWHVWKLVGREPGDPTSDQPQQSDLVRIGKARS
jgi:hypothetical protein